MISRLLYGLVILALTDFLIYRMIGLFRRNSPGQRYPIVFKNIQTLLIVGFGVFSLIWLIVHRPIENDPESYRRQFTYTGVFTAIYFPKLIICAWFITGEAIILINQLINKLFTRRRQISPARKFHIRRFFTFCGLVCGLVFLVFIYRGINIIRSDFKVNVIHIHNQRIPESFDGFRIVQISDLHLGSWVDTNDIIKGIGLVKSTKPDIVCITGDLINVNATEAWPYKLLFKNIKSSYGKYAVLGNHDMRDYARFGSRDTSGNDINEIRRFYDSCEIKLLRNHNVIIRIGADSLAILGVDNWGKKHFRHYGKLQNALKGCENIPYKILLSHDPTHWNSEVNKLNTVNLTLSGHTHGMQMAVELFQKRLSPAALIYKNWAGLFQFNDQYLYVNTGFGFLGFPGRIGLKPEITMIILHH